MTPTLTQTALYQKHTPTAAATTNERFEPIPLEYLQRAFRPLRFLASPVSIGLERLPKSGPVLFVGNHTIYGGLDLPLLRPKRQYFHFGEPIDTTRFEGLHEDRAACLELSKEVQREIELGVGALMAKRGCDPERHPLQRLLRGLAERIS